MLSLSRREFAASWYRGTRWPVVRHGAATDAASGDVHQQLLELAARQEQSAALGSRPSRSKADLETLQTTLRRTFLRLLDGLPPRDGASTGPKDGDDRSRRPRRREARIRELSRLLRAGLALQAQESHRAIAGRPQSLRPFDDRQGRRPVSDPAHQPGQARLCRPDLRPRRPGRAEPVLGRGERPVALQPELRRARGSGQPALSPGNQPGSVSDLGRDARHRLPDLAPGSGSRRGSAVSATRAAARSPLTSRRSTRASRSPRSAAISRRSGAGWATASRRTRPPIPSRTSSASSARGSTTRGCSLCGCLGRRSWVRPALISSRSKEPGSRSRRQSGFTKSPARASGSNASRRRDDTACRSHSRRPSTIGSSVGWPAATTRLRPRRFPVTPRPARELLVCADGQVNLSLRSRPLLPLALEEFDQTKRPAKQPLADLLRLDPELADYRITETAGRSSPRQTMIVCFNGNETVDWRKETGVSPSARAARLCGHGRRPARSGSAPPEPCRRGPRLWRPARRCGGEHRLQRVPGRQIPSGHARHRRPGGGEETRGPAETENGCALRAPGRRPDRVSGGGRGAGDRTGRRRGFVAELPRVVLSRGAPINAASILPGILQRFGDVAEVLAQVAPRKVLVAAGAGESHASTGPFRSSRGGSRRTRNC